MPANEDRKPSGSGIKSGEVNTLIAICTKTT
jgi:hypothetical protein